MAGSVYKKTPASVRKVILDYTVNFVSYTSPTDNAPSTSVIPP